MRPKKHDLVSYLRIPGFESYIGHMVINLSNTPLNQHQIKALEKGLTFCPTPGPPDKSQIWLDFKEFHRRLELMKFFNREKSETPDPLNNQSIIDFMNQNVQSEINESQLEDSKNKEIQKYLNLNLVGGQTHQIEH